MEAMEGGDEFLAEQAYQQRAQERERTMQALAAAEAEGVTPLAALAKGAQGLWWRGGSRLSFLNKITPSVSSLSQPLPHALPPSPLFISRFCTFVTRCQFARFHLAALSLRTAGKKTGATTGSPALTKWRQQCLISALASSGCEDFSEGRVTPVPGRTDVVVARKGNARGSGASVSA